jgi:type I restriction enzyme S subunit
MTQVSLPQKENSSREWLGIVPKGWHIAPIKRAAVTGAGSGFPVELQGLENEDITFLKVNALSRASDQGVITTRDDTVSLATAKALNAKVFPAGSIVLAKIGAALLLGRIRILGHESCIDNNMMAVMTKPETDGSFLFYALTLVKFDFLVNPGAVPSTSEGALGNYHLAFPPRDVQVAIASFLDRETAQIDVLIHKQQQLIETLAERRKAVITRAVTRGLDPTVTTNSSVSTWLGEYPSHWVEGAIKHFTILVTDGAHISPETENGTYDFVSTRDVKKGQIDFEGSLKTTSESYEYLVRTGCQPRAGDVLVTKDGTIGQTAQVQRGRDFVVSSSLIIVRPDSQRLDSTFLDFLYQSQPVQEQIRSFIKGAGLPRLSIANLLRLVGVIPPLQEQEEIVLFLGSETSQADTLTAKATLMIEVLKERRQALISAAVTGKIDVRETI